MLERLGPVDINDLERLDLTARQRLAISQELEYQQLGLPPFSDPSPWQRLSRDQQIEFNKKYLALPRDLQVVSLSPVVDVDNCLITGVQQEPVPVPA